MFLPHQKMPGACACSTLLVGVWEGHGLVCGRDRVTGVFNGPRWGPRWGVYTVRGTSCDAIAGANVDRRRVVVPMHSPSASCSSTQRTCVSLLPTRHRGAQGPIQQKSCTTLTTSKGQMIFCIVCQHPPILRSIPNPTATTCPRPYPSLLLFLPACRRKHRLAIVSLLCRFRATTHFLYT